MKRKILFLVSLATLGFTAATNAQLHNQQWITTLNSSSESFDAFGGCNMGDFFYLQKRIAVNGNNSKVAITGVTQIAGCDVYNAVLDAATGNTLLDNAFISSGNDFGQAIVSDLNNDFILSGTMDYSGVVPSSATIQSLLRKIDSNNNIAFDSLVSPSMPSTKISLGSLATDNVGNIYSGGLGYTGSANLNVLHKFSPTGNLLWRSIINDYDWYYGYPGGLTLDPSGNAIFTGKRQTNASPSTYDIVVRKVDANGLQLWQVYYNVGEDYLINITTDAQGDIYFTVEVKNIENRLVKLSGATGEVLWSIQYSSGPSVGGNVQVNANGNVLVCYAQTKAFDANTGSLLWTSNFSSPVFDTDDSSKIYSVINDKVYIIESNGILSDSIAISIPDFTVVLRDIAVSGNSFYVTGQKLNGSNSKIFVAKYSTQTCAATVNAFGSTTFCQGGSVILNANSETGLTYQWQNNSIDISGANNASYTADTAGSYTVVVTDSSGCSATSTATLVTVNPAPAVSISGLSDFTNYNANPITMSGNPNGGSFTGQGMSDSMFDPQAAGLGSKTITYAFTSLNGCSNTASQTTIVYDTLGVVCMSYDTVTTNVYDTLLTTVTDTLIINTVVIGLNPPNNLNTLRVFPNPASTHITIDYGNFVIMSGYQLLVENSLGQQVFQTNITQQSDYLNLSGWGGNGLYFVRIVDPLGNTIDIRKIVLQ